MSSKSEPGFTRIATVACTLEQAEAIEWALDAMRDMAGTEDCSYTDADLPLLTGGLRGPQRFLHLRSWKPVGDLLYRLEEQLPMMAEQDSNVRKPRTDAAKRAAATIRKVAKSDPAGRAALAGAT